MPVNNENGQNPPEPDFVKMFGLPEGFGKQESIVERADKNHRDALSDIKIGLSVRQGELIKKISDFASDASVERVDDFNRHLIRTIISNADNTTSNQEKEEMTAPSREEIDAKLALVEARSETRFTELSGKLDRIADSIASFQRTASAELADLKSGIDDVEKDNKNTRITIIVTVVAAVISAVAAIYTVQGSLLTAFQTGLAAQSSSQPSAASVPHNTTSPSSQTPNK